MSFWDYPGQYAGPYGRPARPGVFSNIVNAAGALASLANTGTKMYQGYQQGQRQKALDPITMAQALHPEQPYQPTEEQAGAIQKTTGYAMPRGAAGGVAPIGPAAPKTLDEAILRGLITPEEIAAYQQLHPKAQYGIYKPDTGEIISTGPMRTTVAHPYESPEAKETLQEKRDRAKESLIRGRPTTEVDEDTGLPTATVTGRVHFKKSAADQGVTFVTPQEVAANPGKVWPKGTKTIKQDDPLWNSAMTQANQALNSNPRYMNVTDPQKRAAAQAELAKEIYTQGKANRPSAAGGGGVAVPEAAKQIPANHRQRLSDGSVWENRDGQITKVQ